MVTPMPDFDPRAVIGGRGAGRPRAGFIAGIVVAIGCGMLVLGADLLQSVDAAGHSVAPFFIALPFALLPVPLLVALVLLADRLEPEPPINLVFAFAWGAGIAGVAGLLLGLATSADAHEEAISVLSGFDIPAHDWFRGTLRGLLLDTLSEEAVGATGIFDAGAIHRLIRDHMERRINIGYHLWGLVTLFLWMKRWKVEIRPPAKDSRLGGSPALASR